MQLSYPLQLRTKASLDLEQLQFSVLSSWMKYLIWRQQAPGIKYICWQISHWTQSFIWYQWRLLRHRTKRIPTSNFNQICQRRGKLVQPSSTPPHQRLNSQVMTYKTQTCSMPVLLIFLVVNSGMIMRQERARSLTKCYQELCLINLEHMIPASVSCVTPQFIKQTLKAVIRAIWRNSCLHPDLTHRSNPWSGMLGKFLFIWNHFNLRGVSLCAENCKVCKISPVLCEVYICRQWAVSSHPTLSHKRQTRH